MYAARVKWVLTAMMAVAGVAMVGCSTNPATGERQLTLISTQQEIAMGLEAAPTFEQEFGGAVPDEKVQAYIRRVGQRVASQSERDMPYEFTLLRSSIPNAFALPGGKIYITDGLLQVMASERELAAVLGHETGHVAALHNVQGMQRQMGASVLADLAGAAVGGKAGEVAKVATQVTSSMVNLRYGRKDEYEADLLGVRYVAKAGYNPWGVVEMLNSLAEVSGGGGGGRIGEMLSTHPLTQNRIEDAEKIVQTEYPQARRDEGPPDTSEFRAIREAAKKYMVQQ